MSDSKVGITIPEEMIRGLVAAEIVARMNACGGGKMMIEAIVHRAFTEKRNSYDNTTVFDSMITEMLRAVVKEVMNEWLATNREAIKASLFKLLEKNKKQKLLELVDRFAAGLGHVYTNVELTVKE